MSKEGFKPFYVLLIFVLHNRLCYTEWRNNEGAMIMTSEEQQYFITLLKKFATGRIPGLLAASDLHSTVLPLYTGIVSMSLI